MLEETVKRIEPKEAPKKTRWDKINLLLYKDSQSYDFDKVIDNIENDKHVVSYAYIEHDNDFFNEETFDKNGHLLGHKGEKKKDHVHVVCSFSSRKTLSDISLWLGVPQNHIEKCKNFDGSILYLTHRNAEDKFQYDVDNVHTNIKDYVTYLHDNYVPKLNPIPMLYKYLEDVQYPTFNGFVKFIGMNEVKCSLKYWGVVRDIIKEAQYGVRIDHYENLMKYEDMKRDALSTLLQKYGKVSLTDIDGKVQQFTLNENGEIDLLGYHVGGNDK